MNNEISVIVPVYKCEAQIEACIQSVMNQDFSHWRLILVDDGSPDNSLSLCKKYAALDARVSVIEQANGGPGKARNSGIEACKTRWFTFLDSDDKVDIDYLSNFRAEEINDDTTLSVQGFKRIDIAGHDLYDGISFQNQVYEGKHFMTKACSESGIFMYGQSCGKLYNKHLVDLYNIRFPEDIRHSEDHVFFLNYLLQVTRIILHTGEKYLYQLDNGTVSLTHRIIPYEHAIKRYYHLDCVSKKFVEKFKIIDNLLLYQISYFSVTGSLSVAYQSLYKELPNRKDRLEKLKFIKHEVKINKSKFCPKSHSGKILKFMLIICPLTLCDLASIIFVKR